MEENGAALAALRDGMGDAEGFAILLTDGLRGNEELLAASLMAALGDVPIIGVSAGDDLTFRSTAVHHDGAFRENLATVRTASSSRHAHQPDPGIDALVVAAERRTAAEPDSAALATWQRNLTLRRRLVERTERTLSAEQVLRAVIDSIDAGLCILDESGRIIGTNQVWPAMLAKVDGVLSDEPSFFTLAAERGDGLGDLLRAAAAAVRQVLAGRSGAPIGTCQVGAVEGPRWWQVRVAPVRGHGTARAVLSLTDETTVVRTQDELREATRGASHLALVARHMDDAVVLADAEGRIEWVNDVFTEMSGYTFDEVMGRLRTDFFGSTAAQTIDLAAMAAGDSAVMPDFESLTKDGRLCWLRVELYRVVDDGIVRMVAVERDVTARVKAQRSRAQRRFPGRARSGRRRRSDRAPGTGRLSRVSAVPGVPS